MSNLILGVAAIFAAQLMLGTLPADSSIKDVSMLLFIAIMGAGLIARGK